jgi:uncharacterized protein YndB with AHSA1/START domain
MSNAETARVTTFVAVSPDDAFEVFTAEIDVWWRRGARFRGFAGDASELCFEHDTRGRRLVERGGGQVFEIGRVLVWEPGRRLVFEWRGRNFKPGEITEVELRFESSGEGTRVMLEHRGWQAIRADHPARHGLQERAFGSMIGQFWGDLLSPYRQYVAFVAQRA